MLCQRQTITALQWTHKHWTSNGMQTLWEFLLGHACAYLLTDSWKDSGFLIYSTTVYMWMQEISCLMVITPTCRAATDVPNLGYPSCLFPPSIELRMVHWTSGTFPGLPLVPCPHERLSDYFSPHYIRGQERKAWGRGYGMQASSTQFL
jgi:hypothetical protein